MTPDDLEVDVVHGGISWKDVPRTEYVAVDLNGIDDVVENVWGFATHEDAQAFCEANWGHGYTVHKVIQL